MQLTQKNVDTQSEKTTEGSSGNAHVAGISLFSPAKLNLFFRVLNRREDGYHEIASLFQTVDFGDYLHFSIDEEDRLTCDDSSLPCDFNNLIFKAIQLFRKKTGLQQKIHVHLNKRIPIQAGLGGGSSNAATALWALNQLFGQQIPLEEMRSWAAEIGSDVAFFFSSGTAYCTGRGEKIHDMPQTLKHSLWIAKPACGLSTPLVYKQCIPSECVPRDPSRVLSEFLEGKCSFFNDLEHAAFTLMPSLKEFKQRLLRMGFDEVVMTGSGTAFFCIGDKVVEPILEDTRFVHARFISRERGEWYAFPKHSHHSLSCH